MSGALLTPGAPSNVTVERCASGRLRDAYPTHERDYEICIDAPTCALTDLLRSTLEAVLVADPTCRRLVYAAPEGDTEKMRAAEDAGFRRVVTVDLREGSLDLMVAEPAWVTRVDMDLARVPVK